MLVFGQICLLGAFTAAGYCSFTYLALGLAKDHRLRQPAFYAAVASVLLLSLTVLNLANALLVRDYRYAYVVQYCSQHLPWHYRLSALWVGQAGSLLIWAWLLGLIGLVFHYVGRRRGVALTGPAFGLLMAYCCFLTAAMTYAANPMEGAVLTAQRGAGLSPLLQHPAMLIHPPIVFLGYAAWTTPCALAMAALFYRPLDSRWVRLARPWALFAWAVLGAGILLGAEWAYEELGWGGYWGWDPVENGSLIPWLLGTAFLHTLMTWQRRGMMKKACVALAIGVFAACNFATFLTRSGIFSSLHAFSQSPIGWMFLALMGVLVIAGAGLIYWRRMELAAEHPIASLLTREAMIAVSAVALASLAFVIFLGTVSVALSDAFGRYKIAVGPPFYNNALLPTGLLVLAATASAPLLRWGSPPNRSETRLLLGSVAAGLVAAAAVLASGGTQLAAFAVPGIATMAAAALAGSLVADARRRPSRSFLIRLFCCLREKRRLYAGFLCHVGLFGLAIGVAGSSLGVDRQELVLEAGQRYQWKDVSIRLIEVVDRELPDKLVAEACLEITRDGSAPRRMRPAQHFHRLQNEWTTEVAILSDWRRDFYVILHGSPRADAVSLTLVENPMMRWIWLGGGVMAAGSVLAIWPSRRRRNGASPLPPAIDQVVPRPLGDPSHPSSARQKQGRNREPVLIDL